MLITSQELRLAGSDQFSPVRTARGKGKRGEGSRRGEKGDGRKLKSIVHKGLYTLPEEAAVRLEGHREGVLVRVAE